MENDKDYNLLYIDDSVQAGRLMTIYMQRAGFCVSVARDTKEARKILADYRIDAIITDIGLPGENGVDFYNWLKQHDRYKHLPVLLVSAHAFGFDGFMAEHKDIFYTKPLFFPDLISRMKKMLSGE